METNRGYTSKFLSDGVSGEGNNHRLQGWARMGKRDEEGGGAQGRELGIRN